MEKPVIREDQELAQFRDLMVPPKEFEDGFNIKTILGAFFVGFLMVPGSIYLGLVAGMTMGPAAEWVTIILFLEVAKRSFTVLKRQEIYILYYIAGALTAMMGELALSGGPFAGLIWNQFLVQSPAAAGFAKEIPKWVSPQPNSPAIIHRTFLHRDWLPAIGLLIAGQILGRMNWFGLGYTLFRITSDYEKLPFPLAPVAAAGATALAEVSAKAETWRWRVFSVGTLIGVVFGAIYAGVPIITGVVMVRPLHILPIPFIDLTQSTESFLPAAATGIGTSLGSVLVGFILPFWAVVGRFIGAFGSVFINPILYKLGILHTWQPRMDTFNTIFANSIDFWLSFGIGSGFAIGLISVYGIVKSLRAQKRQTIAERRSWQPPAGRGDIPIWLAVALYVVSTAGYVYLCIRLVPGFPSIFFIFYGFIWTPFISYVNARMVGLVGQFVSFPFVTEATFILGGRWSGYRGVEIWFAPIPLNQYGGVAQGFRQLELTGTKIISLIKAEILIFLLLPLCSLIFWQFIWRIAPIPSVNYPYAQKVWYFAAMQRCLWITATTRRSELLMQAINFKYIGSGFVFGTGAYALLSYLGWPTMLVYGFISSIGAIPHYITPEIFGALLGRYYFAKRFGLERWMQYAPVLLAGFACGNGLITACGFAVALISASIRQLPF